MKRIFPVVVAAAFVAGAAVNGFCKEQKEAKLPVSGKAVSARTAGEDAPPEGVQVILKGIVLCESETMVPGTQVVIKTDTGQTYVAFNDPYSNTLRFDCLRKKVKVKGTLMQRTSFKQYPGIYIQDILEVK